MLSIIPKENFSGFISIPMILDAPAILHPITTASPTAPSPHTATDDPGSTYSDSKTKFFFVNYYISSPNEA